MSVYLIYHTGQLLTHARTDIVFNLHSVQWTLWGPTVPGASARGPLAKGPQPLRWKTLLDQGKKQREVGWEEEGGWG